MRIRLMALVAAGAFFAATSVQASSLIVNGDFSTPAEGGSWGLSSPILGWTSATLDTIEVGTSPIYGLACISASCQNLEVNANTFGSVYQTVVGLTPGQTYNLAFDYGGRPGGGDQALQVFFGGNLLATDTGSFGVWTLNSFLVTPTSTTEVLMFTSLDLGGLPSYGNEITNVALTATPLPAALPLFASGFGVIGLLARRRKRKAQATALSKR